MGARGLALMPDPLADAAASERVELLDYHGWFCGNGIDSRDSWVSDDCAHPTSVGHHQLRRLALEAWTGERCD